MPDYEINCLTIQHFKSHGVITILTSNSIEDALKLYDQGASYVIVPRFLSGEYAAKIIEVNGFDNQKYIKKRVEHIDIIGDRKDIRHFTK